MRVLWLYPDHMNIYADRGNIAVLERRCAWRGIEFSLATAGPGRPVDPRRHDLLYIGGGQDRDQALVARDLVDTKRDAIAAALDPAPRCSPSAAAISCSATPTSWRTASRSRASAWSTCARCASQASA